MADRLVLETEARGEDKTARDCSTGGGEPLVKAEGAKGGGKPLPDGGERMQNRRGLVRQMWRERLVVHEPCEPDDRHPMSRIFFR